MIRIGAQCSISRGLSWTLEEAHLAGLNAIQVFSRSPVAGQTKGLPPLGESLCALQAFEIHPLLVHAPYFVNPAATDAVRKARAIAVLQEEISRACQLGASGVVLHPGHRGEAGDSAALASLSDTLAHIIGRGARVLLENAAGQGKEVGDQLADLKPVFETHSVASELGLIVDTAHVMAAGYPLSSEDDWKALRHHIDTVLGLEVVAAIHLNDNAFPVGSRRDRHAHLFEGPLGYQATKALLVDAARLGWPVILETPGNSGALRHDDIAWVKRLIEESA